jgi:hypothetical protein
MARLLTADLTHKATVGQISLTASGILWKEILGALEAIG